MGESSLSMVRKAARLAVYEEIMIRVKNHQKLATVRVDTARGRKSQPCGFNLFSFSKFLCPVNLQRGSEVVLIKKTSRYRKVRWLFIYAIGLRIYVV
jgi:hypothetical protein